MTTTTNDTRIRIRRYVPSDRPAIRQLCADTADAGEPVENFCCDRELIADLVTRYHTDFEPEATWVAMDGSELVGYLTGCLQPVRFARLMRRRIGPAAIARAVLRGALFRRSTWALINAVVRTALARRRDHSISLEPTQEHLHLNLRHGYRGQSIGRRLVAAFLDQAQDANAKSLLVSVRGDNERALRFFKREGFVEAGCQPLVLPRGGTLYQTSTVVLVRHTRES
jgi:GNAT superfamily N-acetyltransferase